MAASTSPSGSVACTPLPEIYGHSRKVYALEFNSNGTFLASGSNDRSIRVWSIGSNERDPIELRGHTDAVNSLAWDPVMPNRLASTGADKTVRIWDTKTGKIAHSISLQNEALNIVYSHDAKYIVVSNPECITLIDTRKNRVLRKVVSPCEMNEVQFSRSGFLFVATGHPAGHGTFEIMRIEAEKKGTPNLETVHKVIAHAGSCFCLDFHPSGRYVALGGVDSLVSLWDLEELFCVRTFVVTASSIRTVRFNHDGRYLAIGMEDTTLMIVETATGELALTLQLQNVLQYLCWHPSKNILAYVGDKSASEKNANRDGVIKMIELSSDTPEES